MIKKVSETIPTMASMVNSYSNSTTNGYSCDYINDNYQEKCVVLWTNSNPTISFGSQDVNINLNNYDYLIVEFKHYATTGGILYQRLAIPCDDLNLFYANTGEIESRPVSVPNRTKVTFGNCSRVALSNPSSSSTENMRLVPVHIYGYYKEYKD